MWQALKSRAKICDDYVQATYFYGSDENLYILNEIGKKNCCLGKEDGIWIWHKILGHINFENLSKNGKKKVVK